MQTHKQTAKDIVNYLEQMNNVCKGIWVTSLTSGSDSIYGDYATNVYITVDEEKTTVTYHSYNNRTNKKYSFTCKSIKHFIKWYKFAI